MGHIAVIGEGTAVAGYALVGAVVVAAEDDQAVQRAWEALPDDVDVVVLTERAAGALGPRRIARTAPLTVVMPP
ncbi:V-type ATP synthase subunit F [Nocardioides pacificus]